MQGGLVSLDSCMPARDQSTLQDYRSHHLHILMPLGVLVLLHLLILHYVSQSTTLNHGCLHLFW